ncbi:MAG: glycosyltransferase family 4 protein [Nitrososphaeria archaeon]
MNIVFINANSLKLFSGPEHWLAEICPRLVKRNHNVYVLAPKPDFGKARISSSEIKRYFSGVRYYELNSIKLKFLSKSCVPVQIPSGIRADVIYQLNGYAFQEIYGFLFSRIKNIPLIYGIHAPLFTNYSLHNKYVKTVFKFFAKQASGIHVLNRSTANIMKSWGIKRISLIENGVNLEKFKPPKTLCKKNFKVLYVGRLAFEKGFDILCSAIEIVNRNDQFRSNIKFTIVGKGPLIYLVNKLVSQYQNITYIEYVREEDMPILYQQHNLFVLPARFETFPLPPIEAQATGLPVILSDIDELRDIIIPNASGILITPDSSIELANTILRLEKIYRERPDYYNAMQKMARWNAIQRFNIEKTVKRLEILFEKI